MVEKRDEYDSIYGNGPLPESGEELDGIALSPLDDSYEDALDDEGNPVVCDICGGEMKWNGEYLCPNCGQMMSRPVYFNHAGLTPRGPKCLTCNNLFPGCVICPYGYV